MLRPRGRPWFEVETAIRLVRAGDQRDDGAARDGVRVDRERRPLARAAPRARASPTGAGVSCARGSPTSDARRSRRRRRTWSTEMLTAVTEEGGTAVEAAVPGFRVAGKTGTAQKADPATGKYSADQFTAVVHGHRAGGAPAARHRGRARRADDRPLRRRPRGPGLPARRGGQLRYLGVTPSAALGQGRPRAAASLRRPRSRAQGRARRPRGRGARRRSHGARAQRGPDPRCRRSRARATPSS